MMRWLLLSLVTLAGCAETGPVRGDDAPESMLVADVRREPAAKGPLWVEVETLLDSEAAWRCQVGVLVASLEDGRHLYERRHRIRARPASTLKLVTCGAVARFGHLDREVETRLLALPDGDWVLVGGGDPFLSASDLEAMAASVAARGHRLEGALIVDASCFSGPRFGQGWMWDDEPAAYMPHLSGLAVEGATVEVTVEGSAETPRVKIAPGGRWIPHRYEPEGRAGITRDWKRGSNLVIARGNPGPGKSRSRRITVVDPALHAGRVMHDALIAAGVAPTASEVRGTGTPALPAGATLLARTTRPVAEIVRRTLVESDNLGAECLLRLLALWDGDAQGTVAGGLRRVGRWFEEMGIGPREYRMVDGSGVSHYNLLAPDVLVALLANLHARPGVGERFRASLPGPGEGTLRRRLIGSPAEKRLRAKTGTLSSVSCLAGYLESGDGEPLVFAIMMEGFTGPSGPLRSLQDGLCDLLSRARTRPAP